MKMIMAVISNEDNAKLSSELNKAGFFVTKLSLMSCNTTLMTVTEDDKVDAIIDIFKKFSNKRTKMVASSASFGMDMNMSIPIEVSVGGATIFVLNVEQYKKL